MKAHDILKQAAGLVSGDRDRQHGSKVANHNNIAALWTAYLGNRLATPLEARDVALLMVLLKVARTKTGSHNPDDYLDMAGYAGCAGEIADAENPVAVCVPLSPGVELPSDCERAWPEPEADAPRRNVASFAPPFTKR